LTTKLWSAALLRGSDEEKELVRQVHLDYLRCVASTTSSPLSAKHQSSSSIYSAQPHVQSGMRHCHDRKLPGRVPSCELLICEPDFFIRSQQPNPSASTQVVGEICRHPGLWGVQPMLLWWLEISK